ncbi:MAG: hypothetical protein QG610_660, partial [Euryarchaeota archaeon]|nr:hypothetical protein [Euryarchaeota archaeon]
INIVVDVYLRAKIKVYIKIGINYNKQ